MNTVKHTLATFLLLVSTAALVACGNHSTSPLGKNEDLYRNLSASPVPEPSPTPTPEPIIRKNGMKDLFEIKTATEMSFTEGELGKFRVDIISELDSVNYQPIIASGGIQGMELKKTAEKSVWEFSWKPGFGSVSPTEDVWTFQIELALKLPQFQDPELQKRANEQTRYFTVDLQVSRPKGAPTVSNLAKNLTAPLAEGEEREFTFDVATIASNGGKAPSISHVDGAEDFGDSCYTDGRNYVKPHPTKQPENLADGVWRFHYLIVGDLSAAPKDVKFCSVAMDGKKAHSAQWKFKVVGYNNEESSPQLVPFRILFDGQYTVPKSNITDGQKFEFPAGKTTTVDWTFYQFEEGEADRFIPVELRINETDLVKFLNQDAQGTNKDAKLKGISKFKCNNEKSPEKITCRLTWTPSCKSAGTSHVIKVFAKTKKSETEFKEISPRVTLESTPTTTCPATAGGPQ